MFSYINGGAVVFVQRLPVSALALIFVVGYSPADAQNATSAATDAQLLACAEISDTAERTKCFDDIVSDLRDDSSIPSTEKAPPADSSPSTAAPAVAGAAAVTAGEGSAATASSAPTPDNAPQSAGATATVDSAEPEEQEVFPLYSTIVKSSKSGEYHFVVTLENGQVWEETDGSRRIGLPKVGEEVRITKAIMGGRRMKIGNDNRIAWVRRLK